MGAKSTKTIHSSKESILAYPTTIYTLEYKATLSRWNTKYHIKKSHIAKAYANLNDPLFWKAWLTNMMRESVINSIERTSGEDVHTTDSPPITEIEVYTEDNNLISGKDVTITGYIQWKSYSVDITSLVNGMYSQLNGSLSYECIRDDKEKWSCLFYPSGLWRNR